MGGELVWTPVRTNSHDEHEESWGKLNTAPEGEDSNNCWYYRPSNFHQLKGLAMRAGIQHLESVQHQIDERKTTGNVEGSRQFLSEAGIIAAAGSPTDEQALADASTVIRKAVILLRSWLREPVLGESGHPELPMMNLLRLGLPLGSGMLPLRNLNVLEGGGRLGRRGAGRRRSRHGDGQHAEHELPLLRGQRARVLPGGAAPRRGCGTCCRSAARAR